MKSMQFNQQVVLRIHEC